MSIIIIVCSSYRKVVNAFGRYVWTDPYAYYNRKKHNIFHISYYILIDKNDSAPIETCVNDRLMDSYMI
jgi:hypothetical protein